MKDTLVAGDTLDFVTSVPDYPASAGYTLKYRLVPRTSGSAILLTAATSGEDYRVTVAPATTANWTAGEYSAFAWVEKTGERHTVDPALEDEDGNSSVLVRILPDPSAVATYDGRSSARKALDAINAALETYGAKAHILEYAINNRSMRFSNQADLLVMRDRLKVEVWREDMAAAMAEGLPNPRALRVRFARA